MAKMGDVHLVGKRAIEFAEKFSRLRLARLNFGSPNAWQLRLNQNCPDLGKVFHWLTLMSLNIILYHWIPLGCSEARRNCILGFTPQQLY